MNFIELWKSLQFIESSFDWSGNSIVSKYRFWRFPMQHSDYNLKNFKTEFFKTNCKTLQSLKVAKQIWCDNWSLAITDCFHSEIESYQIHRADFFDVWCFALFDTSRLWHLSASDQLSLGCHFIMRRPDKLNYWTLLRKFGFY